MGDIRLRFLRESLSRHVNTDSVTHCQEAAVYITIRTLKLMVTFEILVEIRELRLMYFLTGASFRTATHQSYKYWHDDCSGSNAAHHALCFITLLFNGSCFLHTCCYNVDYISFRSSCSTYCCTITLSILLAFRWQWDCFERCMARILERPGTCALSCDEVIYYSAYNKCRLQHGLASFALTVQAIISWEPLVVSRLPFKTLNRQVFKCVNIPYVH